VNQAQQRLIWGGALVAGLLGAAGVREMSKPGLSCRDEIYGMVDRRGRWVTFKKRECGQPEVSPS
jgi:hypothetical protein